MRRLVAAAAAGNESDMVLFLLGAYDDVAFCKLLQFFRCGLDKAFDHFSFNILYLVDKLFHKIDRLSFRVTLNIDPHALQRRLAFLRKRRFVLQPLRRVFNRLFQKDLRDRGT